MPMPCPSCKTQLGLDLQFIIKNPMCVCPGCGVILDFTVNDEIKEKYADAMKTINGCLLYTSPSPRDQA